MYLKKINGLWLLLLVSLCIDSMEQPGKSNNPQLIDTFDSGNLITIECKDETFQMTLEEIYSLESSTLQALLNTPMKEAQSKIITLPEIEYIAFQTIYDFKKKFNQEQREDFITRLFEGAIEEVRECRYSESYDPDDNYSLKNAKVGLYAKCHAYQEFRIRAIDAALDFLGINIPLVGNYLIRELIKVSREELPSDRINSFSYFFTDELGFIYSYVITLLPKIVSFPRTHTAFNEEGISVSWLAQKQGKLKIEIRLNNLQKSVLLDLFTTIQLRFGEKVLKRLKKSFAGYIARDDLDELIGHLEKSAV